MRFAPRPPALALAALVSGHLLAAAPGSAQLIPVRSVPVASGDQFLYHPSERTGMGSPSIALHDRLLDPWVNPAKGALLEGSSLLGAPVFYHISGDAGAGRSLPLTGLFAGRDWFGGASLTLQQIVDDPARDWAPFILADVAMWAGPPERLSETSSLNTFVDGFLGRRIPGTDLSVGASVGYADLNAMDGVDLLYQASDGVDQDGHLLDLRLGLFSQAPSGRSWEVLLLHDRTKMSHEVRSVVWDWNEQDQRPLVRTEVETQYDWTETWGLHGGYMAPLTTSGWRLGGMVTVNRKDHPKIPDYEIQNIPRDPGDTWAWNLGLGLGREAGPLSFGVDVVFEPIWSDTWSVADSTIALPQGGTLEPGDKTVENEFFFSNVHLRFGVGRETDRWGFQAGLQLRAYDYELKQYDNVEESRRTQRENWAEWTPTLGGVVKFTEVELRYAGRVTHGTGRPGVDFVGVRAEALAAADFITAPSGPLTLQDARVITHQLSVRLPIR